MKHRWYAIGLALTVLLLGGAWFLTEYEQVPTKVWVGPTAAARANPYLAAMRFAGKLGMKTTLVIANRNLAEISPQGALMLPNRRTGLTPDRLRVLDHWIQNGGHAIVEPEPVREIDALLDRYGIKRMEPAATTRELKQTLELPGSSGPLVVSRSVAPRLQFGKQSPDIVAEDDTGTNLASVPIGAGRLTIVAGMPQRFHNRTIGQNDNAELLRRILGYTPAAREFVVLRIPQVLPLWGWLGEHALPTLGAASALLLLGVLRALPRFGPMQPEPTVARRQLREHILAAGRFRWTHGGREGLLSAARDVATREIALMHPRIAQLPAPARWQELATRTGLNAQAIAGAFDAEARTARDFVQIVDTLASIHASLGNRTVTRPTSPRPS